MPSKYTFDQYDQETHFETDTNHNTPAYDALALIGELGELTSELMVLLPDSQTELESEALAKLEEFIELAQSAQELKKRVRAAQIPLLKDVSKPTDRFKFLEEVGGTLWYLNSLVRRLGCSLGDAAKINANQLKRRFEHNPNWMRGGTKIH